MATPARISGPVLHTEFLSGDFEGRPWSHWQATVLVAGRETVRIRLNQNVPTPSVGEDIDYLVELQPGRGDNVKIRAVGEWAPASVSI